MAYAPTGFSVSEIGDIDVVAHGDRLHLFHLTLPNHDLIGHAVSADGVHWEPRPPILRTGDPGQPDDDQIWTMGVASHEDRHVMLYTALDRAGSGRVQRAALATSKDLVQWNKRGVVAEADPKHYETREGPWVSFRDPKPLWHGEEWIAPICARDVRAPWLRRGSVGLLRSSDGERWEVEGPIFSPRRFFELECPQLWERDGRWLLIASVIDERQVRGWVGESPRGPFTESLGPLLPRGAYAARVVRWRDQDLLFVVHEQTRDGVVHKGVGAPQVLSLDPEVSCAPLREPFDLFFTEHAEASPLTPLTDNPDAELLHVRTGAELWAVPGQHEQLRLDLSWQVHASACGLFVGFDEDLSGTLIELEAGRARLVRVGRGEEHGHPWFRREVVQEARLPSMSGELSLRVSHGELELAHDGRTVLFTLHAAREGRVGIWAEHGRIDVGHIALAVRDPA